MSSIRGVANHLRYFKSNGIAIIATFIFVLAGGLIGQSLLQSVTNVNAEQGYDYENQDYGDRYGNDGNCYYTEYTCYPSPTPQPTYTPPPSPKPDPQYICTWMKATISDRTVTLYAKGNLGNEAHITGYKFNYGDGYVVNAAGPLAHRYDRYGTYYTKAWIYYSYYGKQYVTAPCTLIVKVEQPQPTYSPHPTPTPTPYPTYYPYPTYKPVEHHPHPKPQHDQQDESDEPIKDEDTVKDDDDKQSSGGGIVNNNNNINNNNSSATANVYITPGVGSTEPVISKAGYSSNGGQQNVPTASLEGPIELPKTGEDDVNSAVNFVGLGGLVAAASAYITSRRELSEVIFKRN